MNKEIKDKWIEALRSGKYTQGTSALRNNANQFCCLGVLCDILKDETGMVWTEGYTQYRFGIPNSDSSNGGTLPNELNNIVGEINQLELIQLNDAKRKNFFEIADYIEKNL